MEDGDPAANEVRVRIDSGLSLIANWSMSVATSDEHDAACSRLADYLQANKEPLMVEWLAQARGDDAVPSEDLSKLELVDHLPKIFDAMIEALRESCSVTTMEQVQEITARHTVIRWVQQYDLPGVVREVSLLRAEFIRHLLLFDEQNPDVGMSARLLNSTTIHRILDGIVTDATDTYLHLRARNDGSEA